MDRSYYLVIAVLVLAIGLVVAVMLYLLVPLQPAFVPPNTVFNESSTIKVTIYAGEISDTLYGFGMSPDNLSSPGPTLRLQTGIPINLTLVNVGSKYHALQITNAPRTGAAVVFNAEIGSIDVPVPPGESKSVLFFPNIPDNSFFYISSIPGEVEMGMWGTVVVD